MNEYIKNIINTRGWIEIEKMFREAIRKSSDMNDINNELDDKTYAREARVRVRTSEELGKLLRRIRMAAGGDHKDKISYK